MNKHTVKELTEKLSAENFIKLDSELIAFVIAHNKEERMPLYHKILVGIGAFIASVFFIGFLFESGIIDYEDGVISTVWGIAFMLGAIALKHYSTRCKIGIECFLTQSSFTAMAAGKCLFVIGLVNLMDSAWGISIALLIVTLTTYPIYQVSLDQFLFPLACLVSIQLNMIYEIYAEIYLEISFNAFFLLQILAVAYLTCSGKVKNFYIPITYAFVTSLCTSALIISSQSLFNLSNEVAVISPFFCNGLLALALIALIAKISGGIHKLAKTSGMLLLA